jgi:tetratricopeptide (TPR) repeat protein/class 3 adenylate cyclase
MTTENNQNTKKSDEVSLSTSPEPANPPQPHLSDQTSAVLDEGSGAESANVLFLDIVGFTKLAVNRQRQVLKQLLEAVRSTEEYNRANAADQLLRLPTGDGMALVFLNTTPVAPVCCAKHICKALSSGSQSFGVRMGVHSGPVYRDENIDNRPNVTGDGINLAQRVMSCGDEGHIILSNTVAEFLRAFDEWRPQIHDLGEVKVRHDKVLHIFNLYGEGFGNPAQPAAVRSQRRRRYLMVAGAALLVMAGLIFYLYYSGSRQKIDSIAIFPLSVTDPNLESAAEDIALHIRNDLVDVSNLTVKPAPDSLMRYKGKEVDAVTEGRLLDVQAVMKGRIVKEADRTLIVIDLTDVRTNSHIRTLTFPYSTNATKQISAEIIERLSKQDLSAEEHAKLEKNYSNNDAASAFYNEGRRYFILRQLDKSIELFRKAIEADPNYAPARAGLADALSLSPGYDLGRPEEVYPEAKEEVEKALALDKENVEAYYTLGYIQANYYWDWENARKNFEQAIKLSKRHDADALYYYAFNYLIPMKRMDEAVRTMQAALNIDSNSPIINTNLGWTFYYAGRDREAFDQYQRTATKYPDFGRVQRRLQEYYEKNNNYEAALAEYKKTNPENAAALEEGWKKQGKKGYWSQRMKLLEAKAKSGKYVPQYDKAIVNAYLGNGDKALSQLEAAVKERSEGLIKLGVNPAFQGLRSNPRFIKILQSIKLPT